MENMVIIIGGAPVLTGLYREYKWKRNQWEGECSAVRGRFKKKTSRNGKYEYTNWYEEKPGGGLRSIGKEEPDYTKFYPPEPKLPYSFEYQEYGGHLIISQKDYEANQKLFNECLVFRLEDCINYIHPLYRNPEKALKASGKEDEPLEQNQQERDHSKTPINVTIKFRISSDTLFYEGKAGPYVSSGSPFGGAEAFHNLGRIQEIIDTEKRYFENSYNRPVTVKHSVVDEREEVNSVRTPGVSSARSAITERTEKEDMCRGDGDCENCEHQDECPVFAEE